MFSIISGSILNQKTDAIVNTVNCVGVMEKGIALLIKNKYPACFLAYKKFVKTVEYTQEQYTHGKQAAKTHG
jgi:O-acetyl-ADP-ribose deacetylase (regulator of RNase III)